MLNGLDLFSGIGGLSLALAPWVRPLAYCEIDRYCQSVLLSRMREREIVSAPIWDDITTLLPRMLPRDEIDIIYGGFPCQDISIAGIGVGLEGKRSGLFFEIMRLASEIRPRYLFLENVPAIAIRGLDRVLLEITSLGYDSRWTIVSAAEVGALHRRERWFLLAHSSRNGCTGKDKSHITNQKGQPRTEHSSSFSSNPDGERLEGISRKKSKFKESSRFGCWTIEPNVDRVVNGLPYRVDRISALGNAVVPKQAREAFKRLMGM